MLNIQYVTSSRKKTQLGNMYGPVSRQLAYYELQVISSATHYAVRDFFKRLNTLKMDRDIGVLGTGINFPITASGQLLEGKISRLVISYEAKIY